MSDSHGEPWTVGYRDSATALYDRNGWLKGHGETLDDANFIAARVNACAGMVDPQAEIERLREIEAIAFELRDEMGKHMPDADAWERFCAALARFEIKDES